MRPSIPLALAAALLAGCADVTQPRRDATAERFDAPSVAIRTTVSGLFFARATCTSDIGHDIWFGGQREMRESSSGGSITRSFVVNDFQGWLTAVTASNYLTVAPDFEVLGGAEMFNIKDGVTRIHEGTLVFVALDGSHKIVARHIIRNVPGQETGVSTWQCRMVG